MDQNQAKRFDEGRKLDVDASASPFRASAKNVDRIKRRPHIQDRSQDSLDEGHHMPYGQPPFFTAENGVEAYSYPVFGNVPRFRYDEGPSSAFAHFSSSGHPFEHHLGGPSPNPCAYLPYTSYGHYQWTPVKAIEYISEIKPNDVLSGRGGATNSHSGNRAFRVLVKDFQERYLKAKKRDKPSVASMVVQEIRDKGGRFLKRVDSTSEGHVLWIDIGDERAKEKTCQALREGAPNIRKKRGSFSSDDEETKKSGCASRTADSPSSLNRSELRSNDQMHRTRHHPVQQEAYLGGSFGQEVRFPIMIIPSPALVKGPAPSPISIDDLNPHDRELYLRDYLPPDPCISKPRQSYRTLSPRVPHRNSAVAAQNSPPLPRHIVKV